jgi:L-malate glycosyltransferase
VNRSVLMFCPTFRPTVGGAERQAERLAQALAKRGVRVKIMTPRYDASVPAHENTHGVEIERFAFSDFSQRLPVPGIAVANIPSVLWQTARAVHSRLADYDVVHCHVASLQTAGAALAGYLARKPVLCKAAVAGETSDLGQIRKTGASGSFVAWLVQKVVGRWVATTEDVERALVRGGVAGPAITRIPNGIQVGDRMRAFRPVRKFLYLGRLSSNIRRDTPTLIRAFERLAAIHGDVELALVGDGDLLEETRTQTRVLASAARIHVPGSSDSARWLEWADCLVQPSTMEGLSNALLEAMAAGLPCIANDIPSNREVLGEGRAGLLVPVGNLEATHAALARVVEDSTFAESIARAGFERARAEYSIDNIAAAYLELYDNIDQDHGIVARAGTAAR